MPHKKPEVPSADQKRAQNTALWKAYFKNPTERKHEAIWTNYQPLVRHVAERFKEKLGGTFDLAALIAAANVGLLDAIAEHNADSGAPFETLCIPLIRQAMARSLAVQRKKNKEHLLRIELAEAISIADDPRAPSLEQIQALLILGAAVKKASK